MATLSLKLALISAAGPSETPGEIRLLGAGLGGHEDIHKGLLEFSSAEIEDLQISGIIRRP
jgi:hypothetical protein